MALLVLLLAALLVPVFLVLRIVGDLRAGLTISVRYRVLGVVRGTRFLRTPHHPSATTTAGAAPAASPAAPITPTPRGQGSSQAQRIRKLWTKLELAQRVLRSGAVRIARPQGWLEFALADVAETGRLYGFACALGPLIDRDGRLEIRPLWNAEEWLAADLALHARVHPLLLGVVLARARLARRRAAATSATELHSHVA